MNTYKLLCNDIQIKYPSDLARLISSLKKSVTDGEFEQFWPVNAPFATEAKLSDVNETGPWPADYIEWYFLSSIDKKVYQLTVETYHGTGGHWKVVD